MNKPEMKKLYEFTLTQEKEVEITEDREENGVMVQVKKKEKLPVPVKLFLKRPNRAERDELELQYDVEFSKLVKAGVMTKAMLDKEYAKQGGIFTEEEENIRFKIRKEWVGKVEEYQKTKTEEKIDQTKLTSLGAEILELEKTLTTYETVEESLYNNCADHKARIKLINYIIPNFSYLDEESGPKPFFNGDTLDEKLDDYDAKSESEDPFLKEATQFFTFFASLWFINKAKTPEDFAFYEKSYRANLEINKERSSEESSAESTG